MRFLKRFGLKENSVHMGAFDFSVTFVIGSHSKLTKYIQWKFEDKDFDAEAWNHGYEARGKCIYRRGYVPVVWIPTLPRTSREHATFAHECLHAIFHLFEWAEMPITRDTEEVMTHSMAHLIANGLK